jgi:hypothetical protein
MEAWSLNGLRLQIKAFIRKMLLEAYSARGHRLFGCKRINE